MTSAQPPMPPAGWYPDPDGPSGQRYWDGVQWQPPVPPPPPHQAPPHVAPTVPPNPYNVAMWSHLAALLVGLSGLILFVTAFFAWVPPLLFMQGEGRRQPFVRQHAVESLNFQLSMLIYGIAATVVMVVAGIVTLGFGFFLMIPVVLAWFVFEVVVMIQASQAASRGQQYRYPLTIRFVQ